MLFRLPMLFLFLALYFCFCLNECDGIAFEENKLMRGHQHHQGEGTTSLEEEKVATTGTCQSKNAQSYDRREVARRSDPVYRAFIPAPLASDEIVIEMIDLSNQEEYGEREAWRSREHLTKCPFEEIPVVEDTRRAKWSAQPLQLDTTAQSSPRLIFVDSHGDFKKKLFSIQVTSYATEPCDQFIKGLLKDKSGSFGAVDANALRAHRIGPRDPTGSYTHYAWGGGLLSGDYDQENNCYECDMSWTPIEMAAILYNQGLFKSRHQNIPVVLMACGAGAVDFEVDAGGRRVEKDDGRTSIAGQMTSALLALYKKQTEEEKNRLISPGLVSVDIMAFKLEVCTDRGLPKVFDRRSGKVNAHGYISSSNARNVGSDDVVLIKLVLCPGNPSKSAMFMGKVDSFEDHIYDPRNSFNDFTPEVKALISKKFKEGSCGAVPT